jgi:hypothetical protein
VKAAPNMRRAVEAMETGRILREETKAVCASMLRTREWARVSRANFREWLGALRRVSK